MSIAYYRLQCVLLTGLYERDENQKGNLLEAQVPFVLLTGLYERDENMSSAAQHRFAFWCY